ncbi:hypothetical protein TPA0907_05390 [Micromonospora humidisoli]|uniref:Integral membrane protein n=1 Tax=Micromonospora humidisoli TaxID=2807622 RepID=A0ABS2J8Z4_9ACTN|nr:MULTISPECIES: hypothetical protein [Micromonospora]MBM7082967.1 hypothetical protein [Micromonospora humidisoli]GHJ06172.1 hypothetical protein TPA0907_05390 [Micromonospora sp. AKA109]
MTVTGTHTPPPGSSMPGGRYVDTALLTGRPGTLLGALVETVVLVLAAGADIAAFYNALSSGIGDNTYLLYMLVAGFTAVALLLAHGFGRIYRDLDQRAPGARRLMLYACLTGWALLGIAAFLSRLLLADVDVGPGFGTSGAGGSTAGGSGQEEAQKARVLAILFLALYIGTGMAAAVVAYWNHNSLAHAYHRSNRRLAWARWWAKRRVGAHEKVLSRHRQRYNEWARAEAAHAAARAKRLALAEELKQLARQRMAAAGQDPATTDGLFTPDRYGTPTPSPYREHRPDG